jgi:NADP-dependent 3-hydroxy acid dehydrogenase YdfG
MIHPFSLTGKRALITGAGRGIGESCTKALAGAGAHVTLMARTATEIDAVAQEIKGAGGSADTVVCDVTNTSAFRAALKTRPAYDIFLTMRA